MHGPEKCFSQTANTMLELVTLPCPYKDEGCIAVGLNKDMEKHALECMFKVEEEATDGRTCTVRGCKVATQGQKQKASLTKLNSTQRAVISDPNRLVPVQIRIPAQQGNPASQPRALNVQVPAHALQQGGSSGSILQQVLTQAITRTQALSLPPEDAASFVQTQINQRFRLV